MKEELNVPSKDFFFNLQMNQNETDMKRNKTKTMYENFKGEKNLEDTKLSPVQEMNLDDSMSNLNNAERMRKFVSDFGKLEFEPHSNKSYENSNLQNFMFGDIVMIIELYNILIEIYANKKPFFTQNKASLLNFEPDFEKLEFESFCEMLSFKSGQRQKQFLKLIKNLLYILLRFGKKVNFNSKYIEYISDLINPFVP